MQQFILNKNFIGIEAEGSERGVKTLFIADPYFDDCEVVYNILLSNNIKRVYFGAGQLKKVTLQNFGVLRYLVKNNFDVVVEISIDNIKHFMRLLQKNNIDKVKIILSFDYSYLDFSELNIREIKFDISQKHKSISYIIKKQTTTDYSDDKYKEDRET